ncbi:MAG: glucose 1-dehydrogenase [Acidobacteria bacterium]|nr:glucose 1-dehydrogenase [Acidobacteriota bacterium]
MSNVRNFTDLTGRVAVVVGGTSGLGRVMAIGMAQAGADVVVTGRRDSLVNEVAGEIEAAGRQTLRQTADVLDRASLDSLRDSVLAKFGHIDVLLNAAGRTVRKPTVDQSVDEFKSIMDTNLTGTLISCQCFYPALVASGRGRVINIASLSSFVSLKEVAAYAASKSGVLSLTKSLAIEWAPKGVNVNAIAPGVYRTELNAALLDGTDRGREFLLRTPMKRFGKPDELIGAAVLLASDAASFITGECITVDGGFLCSGVNS